MRDQNSPKTSFETNWKPFSIHTILSTEFENCCLVCCQNCRYMYICRLYVGIQNCFLIYCQNCFLICFLNCFLSCCQNCFLICFPNCFLSCCQNCFWYVFKTRLFLICFQNRFLICSQNYFVIRFQLSRYGPSVAPSPTDNTNPEADV